MQQFLQKFNRKICEHLNIHTNHDTIYIIERFIQGFFVKEMNKIGNGNIVLLQEMCNIRFYTIPFPIYGTKSFIVTNYSIQRMLRS